MLARVARVASISLSRQMAKCSVPMFAIATAAPASARSIAPIFGARFASNLSSLLEREIEEEKGNSFEGDELEKLHGKVEQFFSIQEQPGTIEVQLVGQSNGRDVRITFDAADVVELDDDYVNEDDQEPELDTINEEEEEEETDDELPGIRFKVHISSKKDNQGLEFDCLASSHVTVESMSFLNDINDANNEENSKRYLGPDFIDLEPDLQEQFYEFLAQHHIDDDLARFIVEYADFKEQKEYLSFLEQTLKFIK